MCFSKLAHDYLCHLGSTSSISSCKSAKHRGKPPHHSHRSFFLASPLPIPGHTVWSPKHLTSRASTGMAVTCSGRPQGSRSLVSAQQNQGEGLGSPSSGHHQPPKFFFPDAELIRAPLHVPPSPTLRLGRLKPAEVIVLFYMRTKKLSKRIERTLLITLQGTRVFLTPHNQVS